MIPTPLHVAIPDRRDAEDFARVIDLIATRQGRAAAISMHELAQLTGISTRVIQALVKVAVEDRGLPIGTATTRPFGYFWIASDAERRAVRDHFVRRALSNLEHARAFDSSSIVARYVGQLELDFPEVKKHV